MGKPKKEKLRNMNPLSRKMKKKEATRPSYSHGLKGYEGSPIFIPKRRK